MSISRSRLQLCWGPGRRQKELGSACTRQHVSADVYVVLLMAPFHVNCCQQAGVASVRAQHAQKLSPAVACCTRNPTWSQRTLPSHDVAHATTFCACEQCALWLCTQVDVNTTCVRQFWAAATSAKASTRHHKATMHMYHLKVESLSRVQAARCKRLLEGSLIACAHADQRARTALWHRLSYHSVSGGDPDCVKPNDC